MRLAHWSLLALLTCASAAHGQSLNARLNALINAPQVKGASIGLEVVEIPAPGAGADARPATLFSHNATTPLGPASNVKLLTTAAAFERYGPTATFKTHFYRVNADNGELSDLLLIGGGDPAFADAKLAAAGAQTPLTPFETWAAHLKTRGITRYRDLIVDDRVFDTRFVHPNWPAEQLLSWYTAPIGGLNFNANCLDWTPRLTPQGIVLDLMPDTSAVSITIKATRGSSTQISLLRPASSNRFELRGTLAASATTPYSTPIVDPGIWTGTILRDVLARAGISGTGDVRRVAPDERFMDGDLLATHQTPLVAVIARANTNSLNMMAEGLCKRLGYDASGGVQAGSWAAGTAAVEAYAAGTGVRPEWISLDDGSGLSRHNRAAARTFCCVLAHVAARPDGQSFIDTLAVPREDGTLRNRFGGLAVADHIRAKTGYIAGVRALSGYILMPDTPTTRGRRFAFSILVNQYQGNVNAWQDQVCQAIYEWAGGK